MPLRRTGRRSSILKGRWLLPGWVDAHVHIADLSQARRALQSGVTTARSMGVSNFADVGIRELVKAGLNDVTDIVAAGYHVRPRVADEAFLNNPKLFDLMAGVKGPANVRRMVRNNLEHDVNVVKILATERAGTPDTDPRKRTFSLEEMAAAVDEAATKGIPVAAHAHGDEGAYDAVRAGVKSIEHGTWLSDRTLEEMKKRGTYLVPTIATVLDLIDPGGDYDDPALSVRGRAMLPRIRETAAKAYKMGIRVVAGTDTGYTAKGVRRMPDEILELKAIGMSTMEAIQAGTSSSAELLGVANRTGAIQAGLEADLIVIDRDSFASIEALHDVVMVINNGKVVLDRIVH
jgi:imidazolonepropionase-like amidohydrolase